MHPVDFIVKTHPELADDIQSDLATENEFCVVCNRAVKNTFTQKVVFADVYGKAETHCLSCQIFFQGNAKRFGNEGYRGRTVVYCREADYQRADEIVSAEKSALKLLTKASIKVLKSPSKDFSRELLVSAGSLVEGKLGMLPGCYLLVSSSGSKIYAPGKYFDKLSMATEPLFEILQVSEIGAIQDCLDNPPALPFLFVALSRKKADLINNLELTTNRLNLKICSDDGVSVLKLDCIDTFNKWRKTKDGQSLKAKPLKDLLSTMKAFYKGNRDYDQVVEALNKVAGIGMWVKTLPADPHEKISIISFIERSL